MATFPPAFLHDLRDSSGDGAGDLVVLDDYNWDAFLAGGHGL
jgi:hypothetical protein